MLSELGAGFVCGCRMYVCMYACLYVCLRVFACACACARTCMFIYMYGCAFFFVLCFCLKHSSFVRHYHHAALCALCSPILSLSCYRARSLSTFNVLSVGWMLKQRSAFWLVSVLTAGQTSLSCKVMHTVSFLRSFVPPHLFYQRKNSCGCSCMHRSRPSSSAREILIHHRKNRDSKHGGAKKSQDSGAQRRLNTVRRSKVAEIGLLPDAYKHIHVPCVYMNVHTYIYIYIYMLVSITIFRISVFSYL